jgi:hypothetical protein
MAASVLEFDDLNVVAVTLIDGALTEIQANVRNGPVRVYSVTINNNANATAKTYVKFYNDSGPTMGTTAPDMILRAEGADGVTKGIVTYDFGENGALFPSALSVAASTAGGTGGATGPTSNCIVSMVTD